VAAADARAGARRYCKNGFNVSTLPPNVGVGQDLKRIMMASATPIQGAPAPPAPPAAEPLLCPWRVRLTGARARRQARSWSRACSIRRPRSRWCP